ncbi:MAG: hypothetical protein HC860_23730 [Alkalinema sp. RU_4_3]|nr:hypothetical protein [Alkalinema sp. RU_4_3]
MVSALPKKAVTDAWVEASWDEFLVASKNSEIDKLRCYYDRGWMRIETMGLGSGHSQDNTLISQVVGLYGIVKNLRVKGFTNGSFCAVEVREYWIVEHVLGAKMMAFVMADRGSRQVEVSFVLPGLGMGVIEEALRRSKTEDDTEVSRWLMQMFGEMG